MDFWYSIFICSFFYIIFHRYSILESFVKFISLQWVLILTLYKVAEGFFIPLTKNFYNQFILFYLSLLVFYSFFYFVFKRGGIKRIRPIFSCNVLYFLSIVFSMISFLLFIYYFYKYGNFYTFRQAVMTENLSLYVGYSFPLVAASYVLSESRNQSIKFFFVFLMISLILVSSSKIFLVLTIIYISSIYKYSYKISFKKMVLLCILGFTIFSVMHVMMNKVAATDDFPLVVALAYTFLGYFIGGIAAFEMIVSGSFSTGYKYSSLIDILLNLPSVTPVDSESGWVVTGMWFGNVYSGFASWYEYSSEYGVVIYAFIISLVHAFINTHAKDNLAIQYLKAFSLCCLLLIVFYDTYVLSIKLWLAFSLAAGFLATADNKI